MSGRPGVRRVAVGAVAVAVTAVVAPVVGSSAGATSDGVVRARQCDTPSGVDMFCTTTAPPTTAPPATAAPTTAAPHAGSGGGGTGGGGTGGGGGGTGGTGGGGTGGGGSTATTAPTTTTTERPRSEVEVEIAVTDALGGDSHDFFEWLLGECADSSEPPGCEERRGKYFDTVEFHPQVRRYEETLDRLGFRGDSGTDLRRASDNVSLAIGVAHAVEALRGTKGTALSVMVPVLIKMQNNLRLALERGDEAEAASIGLAINRLFRLLTAMDRKADSVTKA